MRRADEMMSYWTFSDVFEEQGVVKTPFYGGFGLLAEDSIPKASFNDFALLHRLGDVRLEVKSDTALVTRRKDGSLAVAVWNLFSPEEAGTPKTLTLHFSGMETGKSVQVTTVDKEHGSPLPAFEKMGSPRFPSREQIETLRKSGSVAGGEDTGGDEWGDHVDVATSGAGVHRNREVISGLLGLRLRSKS